MLLSNLFNIIYFYLELPVKSTKQNLREMLYWQTLEKHPTTSHVVTNVEVIQYPRVPILSCTDIAIVQHNLAF